MALQGETSTASCLRGWLDAEHRCHALISAVTGVLVFVYKDSSAHLCHWVCPCVDPVPFLWKELSKLVLRVVIGSVVGACCGCVGL